MYEQSYEDYMKTVLGYPVGNVAVNDFNRMENSNIPTNTNTYVEDVEKMYPDIYKIVYPMVVKVCRENTEPITEELVERMTKHIYENVEMDEDSEGMNRETKTQYNRQSVKRQETRQIGPRNPLLNDLVKILLLRELFPGIIVPFPPFQGPGVFTRPPFPRPRPPFPGPGVTTRPPFPGPRPPFPGPRPF